MQHILKAVPFALPYILFIFLVVASHEGGWVIFIPFWVWVTMGDLAFGLRTTNLDSSTPERELWAYNLLLWLWVPLSDRCVYLCVLADSHLGSSFHGRKYRAHGNPWQSGRAHDRHRTRADPSAGEVGAWGLARSC